MSGLEPALLAIVERRRQRRARRDRAQQSDAAAGSAAVEEAAVTDEPAETDRISVAVKFTGALEDLVAAGFEALSVREHPTQGFRITAGLIPLERLPELGDIPHVVKVEGSRPMRPLLNRSVPEIGAKELHNTDFSLTGKGVVIGIIDSGIDFKHHSFRKPDGDTRILGLWDQRLPVNPKDPKHKNEVPGMGGLGVVYRYDDIKATLKGEVGQPAPHGGPPTVEVRSIDGSGHGTAVAGVAAGNGSAPGNCHGADFYVGVAPEADLIVVRLTEDAPHMEQWNLIHALDFIWTHDKVGGRPVVINISVAYLIGPHDGSSLVEEMLDIDLLIPGRVVIVAAGNEGNENYHAEGWVEPTTGTVKPLDLQFEVKRDCRKAELELWYDGTKQLGAVVIAPGTPGSPAVTSGTPTNPGDPVRYWVVNDQDPPARQIEVTIDSRVPDVQHKDSVIHVELTAPMGAVVPAGLWTLQLTNAGTQKVQFDCWIDGKEEVPTFTAPYASPNKTISIPGTASRVITVGAYAQSGFLFFNWTGDLAESSSRGPTRSNVIKPDITAPGVGIITAAANAAASSCCACCADTYEPRDGTSFAAPHVAGAAALLLQKNPTLSAEQVKKYLVETRRLPDGVPESELPNNAWGAGKLNVAAAAEQVPPVSPARQPDDDDVAARPEVSTAAGVDVTGLARRAPSGSEAGMASVSSTLMELHRRVRGVPAGERWAALISRHFSEVRELINHNRRVMIRWHRLEGPRLLDLLGRAVSGQRPPTVALDIASLRPRAEQFLTTLAQHGSAALRGDVAAVRAEILGLESSDLAGVLDQLRCG